MENLLYVKYAAAFFLVFISLGVTFLLIRKLADFLIVMFMFGAVAIVCTNIANGSLSSWEEIAIASVSAGLIAGLISMPLWPFSSEFFKNLERKPGSAEKVEKSPSQSV